MPTRARRGLPALAAIAVLLALSGCSGRTAAADPPPTSPSKGVVAPLGDVVAGEAVTDDLGRYAPTVLPADSRLLRLDDGLVANSASSRFGAKSIGAAQRFVLQFLVTQALDSAALDTGAAGWKKWKADVAPDYLLPSQRADLVADDGGNAPAIIVQDAAGAFPRLVRTGAPRILWERVALQSISGGDSAAGPYLLFSGTATVHYDVDKAALLAVLLKRNRGEDAADVQQDYPGLSRAQPLVLAASLDFGYSAVRHKGAWRIGGYQMSEHFAYVDLQ